MSSPPETDREYAYFQALGTADTQGLNETLAMQASERWNVGDLFERRGQSFSRRSSSWKFNSGLDDRRKLEEHIEALLTKLTPKRNELLELNARFRLQIVCVSYAYQSFSLILPFELQRQATELGIGFSFAGYSFGDHHDEIVELREQVGVGGERLTK